MSEHTFSLDGVTTKTSIDLALLEYLEKGTAAGLTTVESLFEYIEAECQRVKKVYGSGKCCAPGPTTHNLALQTYYGFQIESDNKIALDYAQRIIVDLNTNKTRVKMDCFHLRGYLETLKKCGVKDL